MRLLDHDEPIDPEVAAVLDAIDGTLAGEPVDAQFAEMAEIALLLCSERPRVRPEFARSMDERTARRFAPAPGASGGAGAAKRSRRRWPSAGFWEVTGALSAAVALIVGLVVVAGGGHAGSSSSTSASSAGAAASSGAASRGAASSSTASSSTASTPGH